jgi:nephron
VNSATEIPLFETKVLSVHCKYCKRIDDAQGLTYLFILFSFTVAPETAKISVTPEELKTGMEATLTCDSSSSNPEAVITWHKEGIPVEGIYSFMMINETKKNPNSEWSHDRKF